MTIRDGRGVRRSEGPASAPHRLLSEWHSHKTETTREFGDVRQIVKPRLLKPDRRTENR